MANRFNRVDWMVAASSLATFILVTALSNVDKGFVAASFALVFAIVLATKFDFYRCSLKTPTFWVAFLTLGVIHAVAVARIDVPEVTSKMIVFLAAAIDGLVVWLLIGLIERMAGGRGK